MSKLDQIKKRLKVQLSLNTITQYHYNLLLHFASVGISTTIWQCLVDVKHVDKKDPDCFHSYNKYRTEYQPSASLLLMYNNDLP